MASTPSGRTRGPVPKRSDQRRRTNKPAGPDIAKPVVQTPSMVEAPPADENWHPVAKRWYEALQASGQRVFYEPSDWATAVYVAEAMSRNLLNGRFSAQLFAAVMAGQTELLTTEGARRRSRVELQKAVGDPAADAAEADVLSLMDRLQSGG